MCFGAMQFIFTDFETEVIDNSKSRKVYKVRNFNKA